MNFFKRLTRRLLGIIEYLLQKIVLRIVLIFLYIIIFPIGKFFLLFERRSKKDSYFESFKLEEDKEFYYWQS